MSGSLRENVGKKDAKALRNNGLVPAVIYGAGKEYHVSLKHVELEKLVYTPKVHIVSVEVGGNPIKTIIQEVQHHPLTDRIQHVDFIELQDDKKVKLDIPVNLVGRPIGVINGGKLSQLFRKLKVYALPANLPDTIEVDISGLRIGHAVRVRDLVTEDLNILNPLDAVVCSIKMARGAVDEEEEEVEGEATEGGEGEAAASEAPEEGGEE